VEEDANGSCSRYQMLTPLPYPTLSEYDLLVGIFCVKGWSAEQGALQCQQHWHIVHIIIRFVAVVHTS
jgi:hypothetical protein